MVDLANLFDEFEKHTPQVRETYVRAPFGYPGGKWHSLKYILPKLPYRKTYVSGCGGSGVDLINRSKSQLEVFNDRYAGVVAFYRCIRDSDKCNRLAERLRIVVHSREEFIWCRDSWEQLAHDDVERAARWYYMVRNSFGQLGRNFARSTSGLPQQARALANSLELFPTLHARFREVQVENLDVIQCIRDFDSGDTVFYIDPDYIGADPGIYKHRVEHKAMLDTIAESRGFFAVSGYPNDLYDSYKIWDERLTWDAFVSLQAQAFTDTNNLGDKRNAMIRDKSRATEVLWIKESK